MKTLRFLVCALFVGLLLTAAGAQTQGPAAAAAADLAKMLRIPAADITIVSVEPVNWPDSSLGVHKSGQMYLQVITPGFRVILQAQGKRYEYHTDKGTRVVQVPERERPIVRDCRNDLAKRLNITADNVLVESIEARVFPDASLNLPRPGEHFISVKTPGFLITLRAINRLYVYTAAGKVFRYAGPVDAWRYSLLYLDPIPNEPNLNCNVMQVSLAGTNPSLLLEGVNELYPQLNGSLLATRRMSRSGHELVYLAPGTRQTPKVIAGAFDFGDAMVSPDGKQWAALRRFMIGADWELTWSPINGSQDDLQSLAVPDNVSPGRLYWYDNDLVLSGIRDKHERFFRLMGLPGKPAWQELDGYYLAEIERRMVLSKSETLEVRADTVDGMPVTRVIRVWFTGVERTVAEITGLALKGYSPTHDLDFVLLNGTTNGASQVYAVQVRTGEVLHILSGVEGPAKLFMRPPVSPLNDKMQTLLRHEYD